MSSATSRNTSQVPQATGDTQYNVHDAALRGASSAFSKPPVKPKPKINTYTGGNNGALLAATKVGTGTPRSKSATRETSPLRRDWTGGSARSANKYSPSPLKALSPSSSSSNLAIPEDSQMDRMPSPSNIAAKLAAARYSPMKPIAQATAKPIMSERDINERDILPPSGKVGNLLAKIEPTKSNREARKRGGSIGSHSIANTIRGPTEKKPADETPILPITSLVQMSEKNRPTTPTKQVVEPLVISSAVQSSVRSPKPQRKINLPPEPREEILLTGSKTQSPPQLKPKPRLDRIQSIGGSKEPAPFSMLRKDTLGTPPVKQKPTQLAAVQTNTSTLPKPPPKRGSRQARASSQEIARSTSFHRSLSVSLDSNDVPSSPTSFVSAKEEQEEEENAKPVVPPPRRSTKAKLEAMPSATGAASLSTPLPPKPRSPIKIVSPVPPPEKFSPTRPLSAMASSPPSVYHKNYQRESVKEISKHMTGESLSSAIVGAALASSRNASPAPSLTATPPLPIRKHHHHHSPFHHRSPSPQKPTGKLRTTLRKESSSSSEDEGEKYKRKGTRIMGMGRKHPNKHHEGTRKRWRDQITERERKRYEGVWAANKGIFVPVFKDPSPTRLAIDGDPSHDVLNLVTREIWTRSRLPEHVLEEVWDLVDGRGVGRLRREEFVVGLWLVDQRLKGRKLPVKVSESVWASVRGVGVKVKVGPQR